MADVFDGPFGGYAAQTEVQIQASQTEVIANLNLLKALITVQTASSQTSMPSPDFDQIPPHTAEKLVAEIDAIIAIVDAAPVA